MNSSFRVISLNLLLCGDWTGFGSVKNIKEKDSLNKDPDIYKKSFSPSLLNDSTSASSAHQTHKAVVVQIAIPLENVSFKVIQAVYRLLQKNRDRFV